MISDLPLWRIELDNDGGILSCQQVQEGYSDKVSIRYIRAKDKASAIIEAKAWWRAKLDKRNLARSKRIDSGKCRECGKSNNGSTRCNICTEKHRLGNSPRKQEIPDRINPHLSRLKALLEKFDRLGPERFRGWLVSEIERFSK